MNPEACLAGIDVLSWHDYSYGFGTLSPTDNYWLGMLRMPVETCHLLMSFAIIIHRLNVFKLKTVIATSIDAYYVLANHESSSILNTHDYVKLRLHFLQHKHVLTVDVLARKRV